MTRTATPAAQAEREAQAAYMLEEYVKLGSMQKVHELHPEFSYRTIVNRIRQGIESKTSLAAEQHRKLQDEHLDLMTSKLLPILENPVDHDDLYKALMMLDRILQRRAKLHGLDAAQQVQVQGELVTMTAETAAVMKQAQDRLKVIVDAAGPPALKSVEERSA